MSKFNVKTKGFGALMNGLGEVDAKLRAAGRDSDLLRIYHEAADPILEDMQRQTSVDPVMRSHALHDSLRARRSPSSRDKIKITIGVHRENWDKDEYYPAYVEFGHGGPGPAMPHPFIRPAFDRHADKAYSIIRDGLLELLKEIEK